MARVFVEARPKGRTRADGRLDNCSKNDYL